MISGNWSGLSSEETKGRRGGAHSLNRWQLLPNYRQPVVPVAGLASIPGDRHCLSWRAFIQVLVSILEAAALLCQLSVSNTFFFLIWALSWPNKMQLWDRFGLWALAQCFLPQQTGCMKCIYARKPSRFFHKRNGLNNSASHFSNVAAFYTSVS